MRFISAVFIVFAGRFAGTAVAAPENPDPQIVAEAYGEMSRHCGSKAIAENLKENVHLLITCDEAMAESSLPTYNPGVDVIVVPGVSCKDAYGLSMALFRAGIQHYGFIKQKVQDDEVRNLSGSDEKFLKNADWDDCGESAPGGTRTEGRESSGMAAHASKFAAVLGEARSEAASLAGATASDQSWGGGGGQKYLIYDRKGRVVKTADSEAQAQAFVLGKNSPEEVTWQDKLDVINGERKLRYKYRADTSGKTFENDPALPSDPNSLKSAAHIADPLVVNPDENTPLKVVGIYSSDGRLVHIAESREDLSNWIYGKAGQDRNPNHAYSWGYADKIAQRQEAKEAAKLKEKEGPPDPRPAPKKAEGPSEGKNLKLQEADLPALNAELAKNPTIEAVEGIFKRYNLNITKKMVGAFGGMVDAFGGRYSNVLMQSYNAKPSIWFLSEKGLLHFLYGGSSVGVSVRGITMANYMESASFEKQDGKVILRYTVSGGNESHKIDLGRLNDRSIAFAEAFVAAVKRANPPPVSQKPCEAGDISKLEGGKPHCYKLVKRAWGIFKTCYSYNPGEVGKMTQTGDDLCGGNPPPSNPCEAGDLWKKTGNGEERKCFGIHREDGACYSYQPKQSDHGELSSISNCWGTSN